MPAASRSVVPPTGIGYYMAETWVIAIMEKYLDFADLIQQRTNFKDILVRYMQCTYQDAPRFFELSIVTKQNKKVFKYCVKDRAGAILGMAEGAARKEAENFAAKAALEYYGQTV
jgi:dsRNA-specific ribonuclease